MLKAAPDPIDVQDLQFKLHCRIKVFDNAESADFSRHCSLVTCASRFGLIFVGSATANVQVIQLKDIEKLTKSDGDKINYPRRTLPLPSRPLHLSVNCEHTILAVAIEKNNCPCAIFFDVKSFWQNDVAQIGEVRLSPTPGVYVTEVNWNPALASTFTACKSDGSLGIYEIKGSGIDINELPAAAGASCFCWSPKGKQIAVGSRDGKITQLKPDLKAVKVINAPPLKEPHSLLSLQWVSNYQFIGVFKPPNPDAQAVFIVVDAPKTGDPTYITYDDICYSNGNTRPVQFYTILLQNWNILMAASSNSMEVGILGNSGECWSQWIMGDAARAELPLSASHQETLPIGCALDIGSTQPIRWGESSLPPAPLFLLLSHHGTLCCFNLINLKQGIPSLCTPPDEIKDVSGLRHFLAVESEQKNNPVKELSKVGQATTQLSNPESTKAINLTSNLTGTSSLLKVQPQVPITTPVNLPQTPAVNLFGGQATLTPIAQTNKNVQAAFMPQSNPLFPPFSSGGARNITMDSVVQMPTATIAQTSLPKPVVTIPVANVLKPNQPESSDDFHKTEVYNVDLKAEEEAEKLFAQMVREECVFLASEVKAVLHQGKNLKFNLGSDSDKTRLVETTKSLEDFFHEVVEICATQSAEVHILKQNLLQSWAWYEEAKSRHLASEDESMMILIRAQPLDSASEKQLADIQHSNYYLESQISQAHAALDEQWESFQDYCKKTRKIQIPTMEMIFQTMVKQNAILQKQSYILKDIANRIKNKSRSAVGPSLLLAVDGTKDLPDELKRLRMNPEDIYQIQHEHVVKKMKNFSKKKVDTLRSFLKKREYPHISAVKPQLSSSVIQASPSSKLKQYSLLASKTPPTSKELSAKKLDFIQSTPLSAISKGRQITSQIQSSSPIEGLQNFALKFETKNFSNLTDKTFTPLAKNLIASSPNSAFVSTSHGINNAVSTDTASTQRSIFTGLPSAAVIAKPTTSEMNQPVITISTNLSKPFSFTNSAPTVSSQDSMPKSGVNIFSNFVTKPASIFGVPDAKNLSTTKTATSAFDIANLKPTTVSGFNVTPTTKFASSSINSASVKPLVTSSFVGSSPTVGGVAATPPFSFVANSPSSIVGSAGQKSTEPSVTVATTKAFVFSSKTTPNSITALSQLLSEQNSQSVASGSSNIIKVTSATQSPIFMTPALPAKLKSTTVSIAPSISTNSSIFSTPATTGVLLGGMKSSLTATISPISVANVVATNSSTPISATPIFGNQSTTPKQNVVEPTVGNASSSSTLPSTASATGLTVGNTSSTKPSDFGGSDVNSSKPTIFGNSSTISTPSSFGTTSTALNTQSSIFGAAPSTTGLGMATPATTGLGMATTGLGMATPAATAHSSVFAAAAPTTTVGFGTSTSTPQSSIFSVPTGPATLTTTAPQSSVFSATPSTPTSSLGTSTASTSIFGAAVSTSAPGFATSTASTAQPSIFGAVPSTTKTNFGISSTPSIFGVVPSTVATAFGTPTSSTNQSSIFGAATPPSTGFGVSAVPTTQSSTFETAPTSTTSIFGTPTSTTQSVFGSVAANQSSVFGSAASSTTAQQSIFGNPPTSSTAQPQGFGIFGDAPQKSSVFGNTSNSPQSSPFGSSNQPSVFGGATTTSSVFGQSQATNTFGQASAFGSSGTPFGGSSVFGTPAPSFGQSAGSIFGNAPTTTSASIFGGTATTGNTFASGGAVFGTPASSASTPFGSGSVFSSNTTQANAGTFGFGSLGVGSTATTSSGFGSAPASNPFGGENKNVFGSPSTSSSSSIFGSTSGSVFGTPTQNFGSGGFVGSQSPFGQQSTFGQSSFGNSNFGQPPSGPFSSGSSGTVGQTGFGTGAGFQKSAGGFGNSPVFGGSPAFGNAPSFGGAPAFGSSPTFGNTTKIFGGSNTGFGAAPTSQNTGFGAASASQNTGFGNLANQPTVGFGNLAQQAANTGTSNAPFSGNSSFSSWR